MTYNDGDNSEAAVNTTYRGITKADFIAASNLIPKYNVVDIIYIRSWELKDIKQFGIRGNHPYWYGVWYVYRPRPFICS